MFDRNNLVTFQEIKNHKKIVLWGNGTYTKELIDMLGKEKIVAIFDNDKHKWGNEIYGINVLNPGEYFKDIMDDETIIVISVVSYNYEIANQIISQWKISESRIFAVTHLFSERYMYDVQSIFDNENKISEVHSLLEDEQSREYFVNFLNARISRNPLYLKENDCMKANYEYISQNDYSIVPKRKDLILDCGAYTGDTSKIFLEKTNQDCRIFAIEPFKGNYRKLCEWIERENLKDKVYPIQSLLGYANDEVVISASTESSVSSSVENCGKICNKILVEKLDELIFEKVSFIKMDIEGAELDALKGAAQIIKRDKPQMVISAYHRTCHMWEIPLLIKEIEPSYKIFCGHQMNAAFESEYYLTI